jgi:hypothetical protein
MPFPNPTGTTGGYEFPYGGPQPTGTNYPGMPGYPQPLTPNYPPRSNSFSGPPTTGYPSGFPPGASLAPAGYPPQVVNTNPNTGTGSGLWLSLSTTYQFLHSRSNRWLPTGHQSIRI